MKIKKIERLKDKAYRDAFVNAHVDQGLAHQIKALRNQRGWTQEELASRLGLKSQSSVVRYEDPSYGKLSISKIKELASVFDVGLLIKLVPFSRFIRETEDVAPAALSAKSFIAELPELEDACEEGAQYVNLRWNEYSDDKILSNVYYPDAIAADWIELSTPSNLSEVTNACNA